MTLDEQIAVIQAKQHGNAVEVNPHGTSTWYIMHKDWEFNFYQYDYRIAKPVPKKVKYYGWIDSLGNARIFAWNSAHPGMWTRAPWLDGEVEE